MAWPGSPALVRGAAGVCGAPASGGVGAVCGVCVCGGGGGGVAAGVFHYTDVQLSDAGYTLKAGFMFGEVAQQVETHK